MLLIEPIHLSQNAGYLMVAVIAGLVIAETLCPKVWKKKTKS